jgi:hypothetical protein
MGTMNVLRDIATCSLRLSAVLTATLGAVLAAPAGAQVEELGVAAGMSVPVSELAELRSPGPHALAYVGYRLSPALQLRGTATFTQLTGKKREPTPAVPFPAPWSDLRVAGVSGTLVWSPQGTGGGPYGFAGLGLYSLRDTDAGTDPDGIVPGLTLGVGVTVRAGGLGVFGQAGVEVPFTTFGTDTESAPPMYLPFSLGLRVPCCGARRPAGRAVGG